MAFKSARTLNFKVSLFFVAVSIGLVVALTAIIFFAFRQFSINTATEHLRTAAEIARVHLTESMVNGVIDHRQTFLLRLAGIQNLKNARVVRSPVLEAQFGENRKGEHLPDEIEKKVIETGESLFSIVEDSGETLFRGTIPYVANSDGTPNCMQCHHVKPGDVLGAVTMTMSIASLRRDSIATVASISGIVLIALIVLFILLSYLLKPISNTASDIERVVRAAISGNFKNEIKKQTNDEIGQIANDMNRLLKFLDNGLDKIHAYISQLVDNQKSRHENQLLAAIEMVKNMTEISKYKTAIEEDDTKEDIYHRLIETLNTSFFRGQGEFSIYEVSSDGHELHPVPFNKGMDVSCRWCQQKILTSPNNCRVFHTAHTVNGLIQPDICYGFKQDVDIVELRDDDDIQDDDKTEVMETQRRYPLCFPILKSGMVGSIVQIVVKKADRERILMALPYIKVYMADTAPVLEVRRLMETLRESSLRDAMTGLNNRRFLEEYIETLTACARRKQTHIAILMLDLDHFKMINDTYGHDAGDAVLKALANVIKTTVRASDIVIRYGGEEFMVVLQDTSSAYALSVAEKIRTTVETMRISHGGATLKRTISIGVADFPGDSHTFWQAVKFADVALYHAKEAGRNRVVHFTHEMWKDNLRY
ncbi:MAG: diguanylate cyclase [Proteobacteria bacterium]|jgi:diguanylate cyclase (GGDEF)-like protein|nr:diguanylate cyclase [Pseudomonadota bacterium]